MTQETHDLLQKALALPDEEPAELAGNLIASLDTTIDEDADAAWTLRFQNGKENWAVYFRRIEKFTLPTILPTTGSVWRMFPVGTGRCLSSKRVA